MPRLFLDIDTGNLPRVTPWPTTKMALTCPVGAITPGATDMIILHRHHRDEQPRSPKNTEQGQMTMTEPPQNSCVEYKEVSTRSPRNCRVYDSRGFSFYGSDSVVKPFLFPWKNRPIPCYAMGECICIQYSLCKTTFPLRRVKGWPLIAVPPTFHLPGTNP